ncbi:Dyp-type peroxidase, partial [Dietzia sp.]|uniref:Dyp-type peroxidase n=1 Tax=Dietzia sp. TaxID=1871616 RepID=UPI002FDA9384
LTIGFGPSLFGAGEGGDRKRDRFGLADKCPASLKDLPTFAGDQIEQARSHGDIVVQACADDPQVAVHAIRNLARMAFGVASVRWSQLGFGRTSSTTAAQKTPRNMFGFKDGTANIKADDAGALDTHVWAQPGDGPAWMDGGSYLVARRIRMDIEAWDRAILGEQEKVIGRDKAHGAPLGQADEFDAPDFSLTTGRHPVIDVDSHVRLAHPDFNDGIQILRRGYNFTDGSDGFGHLDAGLFFLCYQRDPVAQFVPLQRQLSRSDLLNEYIRHTSTGVYACPPGLGEGEWWGQRLLEG